MAATNAQPAQSAAPQTRPSGRGWVNLVILALLLGVAGGLWAVWWLPSHDSAYPQGGPPPEYQYDPAEPRGALLAAKLHMEKLADALLQYRRQFGDDVRWPATLEDLKYVGLLDAEFSLEGGLNRQPLAYAPDLPAGMDPARWAICSDVLVTRRPNRAGYGYVRAPEAAVVILGDGRVRVLQGDEIEKIGGLVYSQNAPR